jgi:hypothetical protein
MVRRDGGRGQTGSAWGSPASTSLEQGAASGDVDGAEDARKGKKKGNKGKKQVLMNWG